MAKQRRQYSNGNDAVVVVSLPVNSLRFEAQLYEKVHSTNLLE